MSTYEFANLSAEEAANAKSHAAWDTTRDGDPCRDCRIPRAQASKRRCSVAPHPSAAETGLPSPSGGAGQRLDLASPAQRAVRRLIEDLVDRRGFRQVWADMDEDVRKELEQTWMRIIQQEHQND